jgi:hypothetical protein
MRFSIPRFRWELGTVRIEFIKAKHDESTGVMNRFMNKLSRTYDFVHFLFTSSTMNYEKLINQIQIYEKSNPIKNRILNVKTLVFLNFKHYRLVHHHYIALTVEPWNTKAFGILLNLLFIHAFAESDLSWLGYFLRSKRVKTVDSVQNTCCILIWNTYVHSLAWSENESTKCFE